MCDVPEPLHRPLEAGNTFKGGLDTSELARRVKEAAQYPMYAVDRSGAVGQVGWICPKCNTANAPTNQTCFACAVNERSKG